MTRIKMGLLVLAGLGAVLCLLLTLRSHRYALRWCWLPTSHSMLALDIESGKLTVVYRSLPGYPSPTALFESLCHSDKPLLPRRIEARLFDVGWCIPERGRHVLDWPTPRAEGRLPKLRTIGHSSFICLPSLGVAMVFSVYPVAVYVRGPLRRRQRRRRGLCAACGYNLLGNVSGVCPECGTPHLCLQPQSRIKRAIGAMAAFTATYYVWMELIGTDTLEGLVPGGTWRKRSRGRAGR